MTPREVLPSDKIAALELLRDTPELHANLASVLEDTRVAIHEARTMLAEEDLHAEGMQLVESGNIPGLIDYLLTILESKDSGNARLRVFYAGTVAKLIARSKPKTERPVA